MVTSPDMDVASDVVTAEAVAWLARLQGPQRTPAAEEAFKEWLKADPAHARAFARATDVWEVIPGAARQLAPAAQSRWRKRAPVMAAAALAIAVSAGVGGYSWSRPSYATDVGEQQTVHLKDGTRVALNTDSKIVVRFDGRERRVTLVRGEAMFYVAHDARHPFVVTAGSEQVKALGTTFVVRRDKAKVSVTLVEGRVEIARPEARGAEPRRVAVLSPGERAQVVAQTTAADAAVAVDRPKVDVVTAWRRGELMFDNTSLAEAAVEVNRYGDHQVVIDPGLGGLRVSGVFETNSPQEFAAAVAELHGLSIRREGDNIILSRGG